VSGGTPQVVGDTGQAGNHGAFWTPDGQILFSQVGVPITRVSADGGSPSVVLPIDEANNEIDHHGVVQLPSGALLYGSHTGSNVFHVAALLPDGERRILIRNAFTPRYLPTGQLVFARGRSLRVVDFDSDRITIGGNERSVIEDVLTFPESGIAYYSVSNNGTLAYVPAPSRRGRTLMWVDRSGRAEPVDAPAREYLFPSLSPDGTTLAVQVTEEDGDHIWLHRIGDGSSHRLVLQGSNSRPQWTPDGRAIVVASERGEERLLVRQSVDAGTPEQILARGSRVTFWPGAWTPDGSSMLFIENPPTDESRIRRLQLANGASETLPLGPGTHRAPSISPDGRWFTYASDQSGRMEVYVRAVSGDGVARQITTQGGGAPRWSRDGREILLWRAGQGTFAGFSSAGSGPQMTAVPVALAPGLQIGPPRVLFTVPFATSLALGPPPWDVTPDGTRFVMVKASDEELQPSVIAVVEGWFEELKRFRSQQR
jgi:serine/threonine-protein kinase